MLLSHTIACMPSGLNVMDDGRRKAAMVESPLITSSCPVPAVVVTVPSFTFKHRMRWLSGVANVDEMGQDGVWRDASGRIELGFLAHCHPPFRIPVGPSQAVVTSAVVPSTTRTP